MSLNARQQIFIQEIWAKNANSNNFSKLKLTPQSRHHISLYQESLFGRVTHTLANNLFHQVSNVFEIELVEEILSEYFRQYPASHWNLEHCCLKLPEFVQNIEDSEKYGVLADLFEVSLLRHKLLVGVDPVDDKNNLESEIQNTSSNQSENLAHTFLKKPHFLLHNRCKKSDLFELWNFKAENNSSTINLKNDDCSMHPIPQTLFFQKTSPLEIFCVGVSKPLVPFINALISNEDAPPQSILQSLESCSEQEINFEDLQNLITALTQNNALSIYKKE